MGAPIVIAGYELDNLGRDIAELIDSLGDEPVFLVGHDWGAPWRGK